MTKRPRTTKSRAAAKKTEAPTEGKDDQPDREATAETAESEQSPSPKDVADKNVADKDIAEQVSSDADAESLQVRIERVFLKDASFESPASPEIFTKPWKPSVHLDINTRSRALGNNFHEVVLTVTAKASQDDETIGFVAEVQQAAVFQIQGASPTQLSQIIGIACPSTLFPYVREALDNLTVKGGFPALQLAQVNFEAMYTQAITDRREQAAEESQTTH